MASYAQNFTQTIKGQIIERQTQSTIPFATVIVMETSPLLGTISDVDGYFKIENVPVGRVDVKISYVGYKTVTLSNLDLTTGKEIVLNIEMDESVEMMKEVVIKGEKNKKETINNMACISARTFSIEESQRYAGSNNDVSRMATNYAGVRSANDAVNDIVIRGNSPGGLLWRLEGVDIPNPNHFGDGGATGGPVSMLNNNVLSNSDFMTSAFPAEYGNALSGVFDLKMRNGNSEKHEFLGQVGFNGFEFGAEGPISKENHSSYLINYRYSTLGVLKAMGLNFGTGAAIPQYQDLTMKLNFPSNKYGRISVFALGGKSYIEFLDSERDTTKEKEVQFYTTNETDVISENFMGIIGITHTYLINNTTYSRFTLSASTVKNKGSLDSLSTEDRSNVPWFRNNLTRNKYSASLYMNKKLNVKNNVRIGIFADMKNFNMIDSSLEASINKFQTNVNFEGGTYLFQPYLQWQHKLNDNFTINSGVHFQYLALNNSSSIEPRLGVKWQLAPNKSLSLGYGLHSQMAAMYLYKREVLQSDGTYINPNQDLDFTKSHHFVLGYDQYFSETVRLKAEVYYQHIYDAIIDTEESSFSLLNSSSFSGDIPNCLMNGGTGYNYGAEFTLEKFMDKGFYFLTTMSLFDSKYQGSDNIERNTAFNGNYVFNLLGGKEFNLVSKKENAKNKKSLTIDSRFSIAGGQRYSPLDIEESTQLGRSVYDESQAFSEQMGKYMRIDLRIGYKISGKKTTQEWAFDIQNLTNHQNPLYSNFNAETGEEETINQIGFFPMVLYRISF